MIYQEQVNEFETIQHFIFVFVGAIEQCFGQTEPDRFERDGTIKKSTGHYMTQYFVLVYSEKSDIS